MAYTKQNWVNGVAGGTPLSAARLNHMEDGIADAGTGGGGGVTFGTTAGTAAEGNDARLSNTRTPTDASVTNAKVAAGAAISLDKTADGSARFALTVAERAKLTGLQDSLNLKADIVDVPTTLASLSGVITTAQVAPNTVMRVRWSGTAWPTSPAGGRTDISIDWVDEAGTSTPPPIVPGRGDIYTKKVI